MKKSIIFTLVISIIILSILILDNGNDLGSGFYLEHSDIGELELYFPDSLKRVFVGIEKSKFDNNFIVLKYVGSKNNVVYDCDSSEYLVRRHIDFEKKYHRELPIKKDTLYRRAYLYYIIHKNPIYYYGQYFKHEYLEAVEYLKLPEELRLD